LIAATCDLHYVAVGNGQHVNAAEAETMEYAVAATQVLVCFACLPGPLLQAVDGSSQCGNCECEDSEDILGNHLEFVLDY